jgi:hypothetical protein
MERAAQLDVAMAYALARQNAKELRPLTLAAVASTIGGHSPQTVP